MLDQRRPGIGIEFNTWGPPVFGWDNIRMPPTSHGEFIPEDQGTAWNFSTARADRLGDAKGAVNSGAVLFPDPEKYRKAFVFFARLFADLTAPHPDYDILKQVYWNRVYRIYDRLTDHVDPRPRGNTECFVRHFMDWT